MTTRTKQKRSDKGKCGSLAFHALVDESYKSLVRLPPEGFEYDVRLAHGFPIATGGVAAIPNWSADDELRPRSADSPAAQPD